MKIHHILVAALAGLHEVQGWAPAFTSLASRTVPKVSYSPRSRYSYYSSELYVATEKEEVVKDSVLEPKPNKILGDPIPYSELTIGVLKETFGGENRVSQTPDSIRSLVNAGFNVVVQAGGMYQ